MMVSNHVTAAIPRRLERTPTFPQPSHAWVLNRLKHSQACCKQSILNPKRILSRSTDKRAHNPPPSQAEASRSVLEPHARVPWTLSRSGFEQAEAIASLLIT